MKILMKADMTYEATEGYSERGLANSNGEDTAAAAAAAAAYKYLVDISLIFIVSSPL